MPRDLDLDCPINRSLSVLGERWTLRVLRAAVLGTTRFSEFRDELGIAPDVLTDRLTSLVDQGVLERVPYREPGARARHAYRLTDSGRELALIMGALGQWGARNVPWPTAPSVGFRCTDENRRVHVAFVDDAGHEVVATQVAAVATGADG